MAFTQSDIDALKTSIKGGQLRVRFADREVEYRSIEEMRSLLSMMQADVSGSAGTKRKRRITIAPHTGITGA